MGVCPSSFCLNGPHQSPLLQGIGSYGDKIPEIEDEHAKTPTLGKRTKHRVQAWLLSMYENSKQEEAGDVFDPR
jgi:hypothetical protein